MVTKRRRHYWGATNPRPETARRRNEVIETNGTSTCRDTQAPTCWGRTPCDGLDIQVRISEPLVSVIVPVHNAADSLHRALRSVLMQTLTDFELILVDDCSTDESGEILEYYRLQDERVKLFSTTRNGGPGAARNIGLKHSRGSYIAFLDADDFWIEDKLERQVRLFERDEVILSYTSVVLLDAQGGIVGVINGRNKVQLVDMFIGNRVTMSSAMIRRNLSGAREMPGMRNREDHAYWISLLKRNRGYIAGVPEALCGYVKMPGSASSNTLRNLVDTYRMYVSVIEINPLLAIGLLLAFSFSKLQKEVAARLSWLFMPQGRRKQLRQSIAAHWNWDHQARGP